jgi:Zn ribbon nucleic-acid-binding protein
MRLLSSKIYRAYPELDEFDDETCKRYMRRVWDEESANSYGIVLLFVVPLSLLIWLGIIIAASAIFDLSVFPEMSDALTLMQVGFVGMPIIMIMLSRDLWVSKQLRKQINGANCKACGYSLVGLTIKSEGTADSVTCPECGTNYTLDNFLLSREDIETKPASS